MNKTKAIVKRQAYHGIYTWLRKGRIQPSIRGYKKLQRYLMDKEEELIKDQGGPKKITAAREIITKQAIEAHGAFLLGAMFLRKYGVLRPDSLKKGILELQPILSKSFLAFMNTSRLHMLALNLLDPKAEEPFDLQDYFRKLDKKKARAAQQKAKLKEASGQGPEEEA